MENEERRRGGEERRETQKRAAVSFAQEHLKLAKNKI